MSFRCHGRGQTAVPTRVPSRSRDRINGYRSGIDAQRVVDLGVEPVFSTGIAHREPGIGQIGRRVWASAARPFPAGY